MYSKLPAEFGETPTKVVFEGVEPGSAAAQQLYHEHLGEISSFHQKARQGRLISGQANASMQQQMPDGGHLSYTFNNGQETIHVRLNPRSSRSGRELPVPPETRTGPQLAVDVLFNPELYLLTGDVWAYTETTVYHPAVPPRVQPDARIYSYDGSGNPINDELAYALATDTDYTGINGTVTKLTDRFNWFIQAEQDLAIITPGTAFELTYTLVQYPMNFIFQSAYPPNAVRAIRTYAVRKGVTTPGTPAFTSVTKQHTRDQRSFFNVLGVAGAIADPDGKKPYESKSVDKKEDVKDGRLVPCATLKQGPQITREIRYGDAAQEFVGTGFVVLPTIPVQQGAKPVKTVVDVYLGSANTKLKNTQDTATKEAKFGTDDPSFQYDVDQKISGIVRCREFVDQSPIAVKVTVRTNMAKSYPQFNYAPNYVDSQPERTLEWYFAAAPTWRDEGRAPADSNAKDDKGRSTMGELLDTFTFTDKLAAKISPVQRKVYSKPEWPQDVGSMTKICRIEWTPSDQPHTKGEVTITPA